MENIPTTSSRAIYTWIFNRYLKNKQEFWMIKILFSPFYAENLFLPGLFLSSKNMTYAVVQLKAERISFLIINI